MAESSDGFLGAFKHCTLCNPVVYGGHGQSLLLTMFCIVHVCDSPCCKYTRLTVRPGGRLGGDSHCGQNLEHRLCL